MFDWSLISIILLASIAVAAVVYSAGQYFVDRAQLRRRLPAGAAGADKTVPSTGGLGAFVAERFTEERFGVDSVLRKKLRRELLRAGFFRDEAINYYVFARLCTVILLPCIVYAAILVFRPTLPLTMQMVILAASAGIGILGPDAYLSRRQGRLAIQYRQIFPDMLDLLVVCVSAGLSVDAAFERLRGQLAKRSPALGMNLEIMGAEKRAGRSSVEALNSLADRLAIDEASTFVAVLRHSFELGGDVSDALRVFSEEMRDKRMLRAEETANKLSVKMVVPLALFIFPVILVIVMLPIMLKLMTVFHHH